MSIIDCNYSVTGSGPAIFLTHGVGGAEDAWRFITPKLKSMFTVVTFLGMFIGFEGYLNGKLYIGTYTPTCEYGWVITDGEIYLDTIYEKNNNLVLDN